MKIEFLFVKNHSLTILFILVILTSNSYTQIISYNVDSITISTRLIEIVEKNELKELKFDFNIKNLSNNDIYIFESLIKDSTFDSISKDYHIKNLGGGWEFHYGYEQIFNFKKIPKMDSIMMILKFVVQKNISHEFSLLNSLSGNYINNNQICIAFNLGYFENKNNFIENRSSKVENNVVKIDMHYDKVGFKINQFYKRLTIMFPLVLN